MDWIALKGLHMVVGHVQVTTSYVLQESQNLDHMLLQTWVLEQMDGTRINGRNFLEFGKIGVKEPSLSLKFLMFFQNL